MNLIRKLVIVAAVMPLLTSCGKAAREAAEQATKNISNSNPTQAIDSPTGTLGSKLPNDSDNEAFAQYLKLKVASQTIKNFAEQTTELPQFELHPYEAELRGKTTFAGTSLPATVSISLNKGCSWNMQLAVTMFLPAEESIARSDLMLSVQESLNAQASYEQTYTEMALVDEPQSDSGQLLSQNLTQELIKKTSSGFTIEYKKPQQPKREAETAALLVVESERYRLKQMKRGIQRYTYKQVDSSSSSLFSTEDTTSTLLQNNPTGEDLWLLDTYSTSIEDGESTTSRYIELLNKNAIPLSFSFEADGVTVETWLSDFKLLTEQECNNGI